MRFRLNFDYTTSIAKEIYKINEKLYQMGAKTN